MLLGNIGSVDRLDFAVVGPAVNEASRIAGVCRSVDRGVVLSAEFAAATPRPERERLVSLGRYALRGVGRAQELLRLIRASRPVGGRPVGRRTDRHRGGQGAQRREAGGDEHDQTIGGRHPVRLHG